jgi:hypothetical protein
LFAIIPAQAEITGAAERDYAVRALDRIARPVIESLAEGKLKERIPLGPGEESRRDVTCLEAFGRTLAGLAPWLALGPDETSEGLLRARYIDLSGKALVHATDPKSPDFMNFTKGGQPLVDAAFLSLGLLRAPDQLWKPLDESQRANVVNALKSTRPIKPGENNWLLFSALVEAALWQLTGLLHLGLPADDPFWTAPPADWTQKRLWAGENVPSDHSAK